MKPLVTDPSSCNPLPPVGSPLAHAMQRVDGAAARAMRAGRVAAVRHGIAQADAAIDECLAGELPEAQAVATLNRIVTELATEANGTDHGSNGKAYNAACPALAETTATHTPKEGGK